MGCIRENRMWQVIYQYMRGAQLCFGLWYGAPVAIKVMDDTVVSSAEALGRELQLLLSTWCDEYTVYCFTRFRIHAQ
jgi:hypothetical protein